MEKAEFEVISNTDNEEVEQEESNSSESESDNMEESVSETNEIPNLKLMYELYKDNRELHEKVKEYELTISRMEEKNFFLMNSNIFWSMCAVGSFLINIISINLK